MAWTSPKTWSSEPLTSIDLNTYVRDNQNHLKDRLDNSAGNIVSGSTVLSSTSTEFVDVEATNLALALMDARRRCTAGFHRFCAKWSRRWIRQL